MDPSNSRSTDRIPMGSLLRPKRTTHAGQAYWFSVEQTHSIPGEMGCSFSTRPRDPDGFQNHNNPYVACHNPWYHIFLALPSMVSPCCARRRAAGRPENLYSRTVNLANATRSGQSTEVSLMGLEKNPKRAYASNVYYYEVRAHSLPCFEHVRSAFADMGVHYDSGIVGYNAVYCI